MRPARYGFEVLRFYSQRGASVSRRPTRGGSHDHLRLRVNSHQMIGALKMASMKVPVFGFVSSVESHARAELTEFPTEAPRLTAQVVPTDQGAWDAPHQKLLIIDGLVAFKGSTNLTNAGARKADRALDLSEVVTDFAQVARLNNTYFAPVWRRLTSPDDTFVWDPIPF